MVCRSAAWPGGMNVEGGTGGWLRRAEKAEGGDGNVEKGRGEKRVKAESNGAEGGPSRSNPAYHIKEDCVPGMETHLWFLPDQLGSYDLFCTEYCGVGHSSMITKVEVMPQKDFEEWYSGKQEEAAEKKLPSGKKAGLASDEGARLIQVKGCVACHTTDGTPKIGPTFKGVFGKKETVIHEGKEREITVDAAFIKPTLLHPEIDRVKGFPPLIPSQQGQLTDAEIHEIIEYIKRLK